MTGWAFAAAGLLSAIVHTFGLLELLGSQEAVDYPVLAGDARAHLTRALMRGLLLVLAGVGLLSRRPRGRTLSLVALFTEFVWTLVETVQVVLIGIFTLSVITNSVLLCGLAFVLYWLSRPSVREQFRT